MSSESDEDDQHTNPNGAQKYLKTTNLTEPSIQNPNLPEEIIFHDILSRLPVKSLLQFRCVSKSWRCLISDPHFIKKHLNISTTDENYTNHRVISSHEIKKPTLKTCSLYSLVCNNGPASAPIYANDIDYPFKNPCRKDYIVGHCNGILCLKIGENSGCVILWNPSINEFSKLPDSGIRMPVGDYRLHNFVYGFGYDNASDDYKVVAILCISGGGGGGLFETIVGVYSLRTNIWRRISALPYGLPDERESGKLVSGTLIWSVYFPARPRPDPESIVVHLDWKIFALDLATETYREVPQPSFSVGFDRMLGILRGCLCSVGHRHGVLHAVWVMKDFGVKESWTKLLEFRCLGKFVIHKCIPFFLPLILSNDGEILMEFKSELVIYNTKDKTIRSPVIHNFDSCLVSYVYIESLVSPNAYRRDERQHQ